MSRKKNVIQLKNRKKIYSNTVYDVFSDDLSDSIGNLVDGYLSVEAKVTSPESVTGVCVLLFEKTQLALSDIYRHPLGRSGYEAIKGHIEPREDIYDAARREALEESGFVIAKEKLSFIGYVAPEAGLFKGRTALFLADVRGLSARPYDPEIGHNVIKFYEREEVIDFIECGLVEDATTLVAVLRFLSLV